MWHVTVHIYVHTNSHIRKGTVHKKGSKKIVKINLGYQSKNGVLQTFQTNRGTVRWTFIYYRVASLLKRISVLSYDIMLILLRNVVLHMNASLCNEERM